MRMWNRKRVWGAVIVAVVAIAMVLLGRIAWATPVTAVQGAAYGRQTTSVTSSSVPVNVMPSAIRGTYRICNRATSNTAILCGDYTGLLPGAAGANWEEVPIGQCRSDGKDADTTMNLAWACVLESGASASTVDATWR